MLKPERPASRAIDEELVACKLNSAMNALSDWPDRDNVTYP